MGCGDHNCVYLLPTYKTVLKREKATFKEIKTWTEDSIVRLQGCFECTDWNVFVDACGDDLDELTDVTCSYAAFCRDMIIPSKKVKIYPNNRPWVNKSVKSSIQAKKNAFKQGSIYDIQSATKNMKIEILKAKKNYKEKLEHNMATNKLGSAWTCMKSIAGVNKSDSNNGITLEGFDSDHELANAFNSFYNRFDVADFNSEIQDLRHNLMDQHHHNIREEDIVRAFSHTKTNKSQGPDSICGCLLKTCSKELAPIFHHIFNKSLQTQHVPKCWKDAVVVPVPKSNCPKVLNDFRPIALTSIVMKTFEKLVKTVVMLRTQPDMDALQFAYRPQRGVEDATATLLNMIFKHLEGKDTHARLLFIDCTSAFNSIQPHVLMARLEEEFNLSKNLLGWILDLFNKQNTESKDQWHSFRPDLQFHWIATRMCSVPPTVHFIYKYVPQQQSRQNNYKVC